MWRAGLQSSPVSIKLRIYALAFRGWGASVCLLSENVDGEGSNATFSLISRGGRVYPERASLFTGETFKLTMVH